MSATKIKHRWETLTTGRVDREGLAEGRTVRPRSEGQREPAVRREGFWVCFCFLGFFGGCYWFQADGAEYADSKNTQGVFRTDRFTWGSTDSKGEKERKVGRCEDMGV